MSASKLRVCDLCFAIVILTLSFGSGLRAVELTTRVSVFGSAGEERHRQALTEVTHVEFVDGSLQEIVDYLNDLHHLQIQIDSQALKAAGYKEDTPVTVSLRGVRLGSALDLILGKLNLTTRLQSDVLLITTPERVNSTFEVRVYDVSKLADGLADSERVAAIIQQLLSPKASNVAKSASGVEEHPDASDHRSHPNISSLEPYRNLLIIQANLSAHAAIEELLTQMQYKVKISNPQPSPPRQVVPEPEVCY